MVDKFYVPYMEDSASDWSPNCVVKYADYAALKKERNRLKAHLDALAHSVLDAPCDVVTEELAKEVLGK